MRIYKATEYSYMAVINTAKARKVEGSWSSMPRPLYRWVSFDETITTFATQGTSLTLRQLYDKQGKLVSEDIESPPIVDFRDVLKCGKEGFRKDEWDSEKGVWVECDSRPEAYDWSGEGFQAVEYLIR